MPIFSRYVGDPLDDLRLACDVADRDYDEMTTLLFDAPRDTKVIEDFTKRGCDGFVFFIPPERYHDVQGVLDDTALFCEKIKTNTS